MKNVTQDLPIIFIPSAKSKNGKDIYLVRKYLIILGLMGEHFSNKDLATQSNYEYSSMGHFLSDMYAITGCSHKQKICLFLFAEFHGLIIKVNDVWIANWQNSPYLIPVNEQHAAYIIMKGAPIE